MNITTFQRRQPRKSMLGTRGRFSIQLQAEPTPKSSKNGACGNTFTMNISNLSQRPPRKSMLGTRRRESTLISVDSPPKEIDEMEENLVSFSPEIRYSPPKLSKILSPPKRESCLPQKQLNDSFEEHESFLMAHENEESILATTLIDETIIAANSPSSKMEMEDTRTNCDTTVIQPNEDETLTDDWLNLLNTMIEKNSLAVTQFHKQIEDLKKQIEDTNRQTEEYESMKRRIVSKFNLKTESKDKNVCKTLDFQNVRDLRQNCDSPSVSSPSRQIIGEIRSTIKYLKTPRMSRKPRQSVYLTPHSMSFSIKTQYEKLLQ